LRALIAARQPVAVAVPVLQEILQGARTHERFQALRRYFEPIECYAPNDARISAIDAARLYVECRVRGFSVRSSNDCLIACLAIEHDAQLLHHDRDFDAIARVEPRLRMYEAAA
jgi:predicted nucleic acid-binding protein